MSPCSGIPEFRQARERGGGRRARMSLVGLAPRLGQKREDKYRRERGNDRAQHDLSAEALGGRERREEKYREAAGNDEHRGQNRLPHAFAHFVP